MKGVILATHWYSSSPPVLGGSGLVGMVLVNYPESGYAKAYVGVGTGLDAETDARHIADYGHKLEAGVARALWPDETQGLTFKSEVSL